MPPSGAALPLSGPLASLNVSGLVARAERTSSMAAAEGRLYIDGRSSAIYRLDLVHNQGGPERTNAYREHLSYSLCRS